MVTTRYINPYQPGLGHSAPYLAGRDNQLDVFTRVLQQGSQSRNLILTGLRGMGKTVLIQEMKPLAIEANWLWSYTDFSASANITERDIATRVITSFSLFTSKRALNQEDIDHFGILPESDQGNGKHYLNFAALSQVYDHTNGSISDKLKVVLEFVWKYLSKSPTIAGVILVCDEAQNLSDEAAEGQEPLTTLVDVFQPLQEKGIPFMLMLAGLPTLFPKLVSSRRIADSMFQVVHVGSLNEEECRQAILKPIEQHSQLIHLDESDVEAIIELSAGYPYFVQLICREVYDNLLQPLNESDLGASGARSSLPVEEIVHKLNVDFFTDRWTNATNRQQDVLSVVATLDYCEDEFSVQEVSDKSKELLTKPLSSSQVNQLLMKLSQIGLVYKSRYGRYSFAVPLMGQFIKRQICQINPFKEQKEEETE